LESIAIDTGEKRVCINGDESRVIVFNPGDVLFAEKFYVLAGEFQTKLTKFQRKALEFDSAAEVGADGFPANTTARLELMKGVCGYLRGRIDYLFGIGTSETAFGEAQTLNVFVQFFEGITPLIQGARNEKVLKYKNTAVRRKRKA